MNIKIEHIIPYIIPALIWILTISITLRLLFKKQSVTAMLSWLMVVYIFPGIGIFAYLIFGEINLGKKRLAKLMMIRPKFIDWYKEFNTHESLISGNSPLRYRPLINLVQKRLTIPCVIGNELHVLNNSEDILRCIIQDINLAQQSINMVFYIWQDGGIVDEVEQALINARRRGVPVKILLDSVGSRPFIKSKKINELRSYGVEFVECLHANIFRMFFYRIDLRQHRKIIVIDNHISYTGSMNMVDPRYFKQDAHVGEWVDMMVRMVGPVSSILNSLHACDWELETNQILPVAIPKNIQLSIEEDNSHAVQVLASGPGYCEDLMEQSLSQAIYSARETITITSPYFVPSQEIAEALRVAAYRGVKVELILPKKNDSLMVDWASRTFFDDLLAAGVNIYKFDKGLLHTKSVLIDNRLALVGTMNMDVRSFLLNFEVMILVEDRSFADEIAQLQEGYRSNSIILDYDVWKIRPSYHRIIEKLFFLFSPLL